MIHHWTDHRQLIALARQQASIDSRVSADNRVDSSWPYQRSQHAMKPDIGSESRFLLTPRAFDAPVIAITFGTEKLEWYGYPKVKNN